MYPVLIKFGQVTVHTYGFLVATAFLVALWLAVKQARRTGIPDDKIVDLAFYVLLAAIAGSRLFFILTNWSYFAAHPLNVVKIWEGGLVFYGGVILALPVAVWYAGKSGLSFLDIADVWAPPAAIAHAIGRLGCFCAGCCYGRPADGLPWAVVFSDPRSLAVKGVPLHPSQLYESAGEFVNFLILIALRRRQSFRGQLFWVYLMNYSVIRSAVEIFRGDEVRGFLIPGVSISQGISVAIFITSAIVLFSLGMRARAGGR